jgi:hypothetical protein
MVTERPPETKAAANRPPSERMGTHATSKAIMPASHLFAASWFISGKSCQSALPGSSGDLPNANDQPCSGGL